MSSNSKKLLYNCRFDQEDLQECISIFDETQKNKNRVLNFSYHPKPTFLLPIPQSFTTQTEGVPDIITKYLPFSSGYTHEVLNKASKGQFCITRNTKEADLKVSELKDSLNGANISLFNKLQKENLLGKKITTLTALEKNRIALERERVFAAKREYSDFLSTLKGTRNEHLVKMSRGKKSRTEILFKQEMSHYKSDKSVFRGVGQLKPERINEFDKFLKAFIGSLHDDVEMPLVPLFNSTRSPGPKLLRFKEHVHGESSRVCKGALLPEES
jgi:energy-converting hydrogenase A subunit M